MENLEYIVKTGTYGSLEPGTKKAGLYKYVAVLLVNKEKFDDSKAIAPSFPTAQETVSFWEAPVNKYFGSKNVAEWDAKETAEKSCRILNNQLRRD